MSREILYKSVKKRLIKIGFAQIFLGLMEMLNIFIIYKIIVYSIDSIQSNESNILINAGDYFQFEISLFNLLLAAFGYLILKFLFSIAFTIYKNQSLISITEDISNEVFTIYINMSFKKLNMINTSELLQNIRGESVFLTRYLSSAILIFYESITVLSIAIALFYIDTKLTLFISIIYSCLV